MDWRYFFKIGPFLTPNQKKQYCFIYWIIIAAYLITQLILLQFIKGDWIFVLCSIPIVFSGILLGPFSALITGLFLTLYIWIVKWVFTPEIVDNHKLVRIGINLLITLLGIMAGYYSDLFHKGKRTEEELIKARQRAEEANQAKSAFLANISHEIRTPLNAMIGYANLLIDSENDQQKNERLRNILSAGRMLMNLTSDLLNLSRIEAGVLKPEIQPLQMSRLFEDIDSIFQLKAREKNLDFSIIAHQKLPEWILGDLKMLQQILVNLIGNAIKFTEQGSVILECQAAKKGLFFHIRDSGIGIPKSHFEKIFTAFSQVHQEKGLKSKGTGLGLSITQQLVFLLGGEISVDSQLDEGTCFTVWIPYPDSLSQGISKVENPGIKVEHKKEALKETPPLEELSSLSKKKIITHRSQFLILIEKLTKMEGLFNPKALEDLIIMIHRDFHSDIAEILIKPIEQTLIDFDDQRISNMLSQLKELNYE